MEVVGTLKPGLTRRSTILTMGKFDGLHLGHQQLIKTTVERARTLDFCSAVLTWEPHPNTVLRPDQPVRLLTTLDEKIALIEQYAPDLLIIAPFTEATRRTSAEIYMGTIAEAVQLRELWVGEGFAMGRGRSGDVASLMQIGANLGFAVGTVRQLVIEGTPVSASRVRELLDQGEVGIAGQLLGRPFALQGTVIQGDQRGRTIGFPTANLQLAEGRLLPADGVYACYVIAAQMRWPAVTNIGLRPTFDGVRRTVEAHLLAWSGDLYGQTLRLEFRHYLRGEQKFSGIEALVSQIAQDAARTRTLLG
ncbi:bifunctional riboflavin kinase/FAD synthetase [Candidatus Chloroploca sp. Khr17]|uniref:bifunctional riboflavin kinase/FAD synthetase n=1 Tax=Candidatus Chloroploca sp. Khr17 TaxID=2496869 RepID=UPI00101D11DC|nr:bifunctional riboflavin kinase/FAD synthetase [Candidatus Chloroploca sp. Khr17]